MKPKTALKETLHVHTPALNLKASMAQHAPHSVPAAGAPHPPGICIDGRNLALRDGTGVTTYALTLAENLYRTGRTAEVLLDVPEGTVSRSGRSSRWLQACWPGARKARALDTRPHGFTRALLAPDAYRLAQVYFDIQRRLLTISSRQPPALMHWTYPLPLTFRGTLNVYTIHDLIPLRTPDLTGIGAARFGRIVRTIARQADHIVTVSEFSRQEIINLLGIVETRVTNTYQPVNLPPGIRNVPPPTLQGHFLFCGSIEPRKNVARLIKAYRASGAAAPLILAGPDGWRAAEALAAAGPDIPILSIPLAANAPPAPGSIWRIPWLPRPALIDLLRGARALLFPSLAEGFGLPVAEAMALGVPVLTSAQGATAEVAGDAALLIDPTDTRAMANAIAALDRDTALCDRLAAAGLRRSGMFSPEACFSRLAAIYDKLEVPRI
jgi:glycosyltransferase involved in cell wall biosynthesis